jgi:hypothetical protein
MPRIIQIGLLISVCLPGRLDAQTTSSPASATPEVSFSIALSASVSTPAPVRSAKSLKDLGPAPIRNFNKAVVSCLATGGYGNVTFEQVHYLTKPEPAMTVNPCSDLNFKSVFLDGEWDHRCDLTSQCAAKRATRINR